MTESKAKKFEHQFQKDWLDYIPKSFCYRLYDVMSGYMGIRGICDFICFKSPYLFLIDCKTHAGNTINFSDFSQYESMLEYMDIDNLFAGTIVWFYDNDKVVWIPIQTWQKLKQDGKKSFNVKYIESQEYYCLEIPSKKKRVFMESNYSVLIDEVNNGRV